MAHPTFVSPQFVSGAVRVGRPAANPLPAVVGWCRAVLEASRARREMAGIDASTAKDIGVPFCGSSALASFRIDPRPLWGIGQTPLPMRSHES